EILSSFLVIADLHEVVDSRFSAQGARVGVVHDGLTNLGFQHRAFCNSQKIEEWESRKQPVKLKAVVYALSPFQQKIMTGLWKDLPEKIHHKVSENELRYAQRYQEQEKLEHRF
ncbi:unnamed protein product, partial [Brassica oleracea]